MSIPNFNTNDSLYPVILEATSSMIMYHRAVVTHLVTITTYTPSYKRAKKPTKIKDFKSPRNYPLIVLDYWSKKLEEYFHLNNHNRINISENLQHIM